MARQLNVTHDMIDELQKALQDPDDAKLAAVCRTNLPYLITDIYRQRTAVRSNEAWDRVGTWGLTGMLLVVFGGRLIEWILHIQFPTRPTLLAMYGAALIGGLLAIRKWWKERK